MLSWLDGLMVKTPQRLMGTLCPQFAVLSGGYGILGTCHLPVKMWQTWLMGSRPACEACIRMLFPVLCSTSHGPRCGDPSLCVRSWYVFSPWWSWWESALSPLRFFCQVCSHSEEKVDNADVLVTTGIGWVLVSWRHEYAILWECSPNSIRRRIFWMSWDPEASTPMYGLMLKTKAWAWGLLFLSSCPSPVYLGLQD